MLERRQRVVSLYLRHVPKGRIAELLEVSANTITADIKWIEEEWPTRLLDDVVEVKARELALLNDLEREAADRYQGYYAMDKGTKDREPAPVLVAGDGHWWDRMLEASVNRRKLLGLDAPAKQELTGKDGAPLITHVEIVKDYGPETHGSEPRMEIIKNYGPEGER